MCVHPPLHGARRVPTLWGGGGCAHACVRCGHWGGVVGCPPIADASPGYWLGSGGATAFGGWSEKPGAAAGLSPKSDQPR